jgi:hypothetical protein
MTITELNLAIMFGEFTNDQLNSLMMAIKFNRARLGKQNKYAFSPGDTVRFDSRGKRYVGIVKRILDKNEEEVVQWIVVQTSLGTYRVPANMLEAA